MLKGAHHTHMYCVWHAWWANMPGTVIAFLIHNMYITCTLHVTTHTSITIHVCIFTACNLHICAPHAHKHVHIDHKTTTHTHAHTRTFLRQTSAASTGVTILLRHFLQPCRWNWLLKETQQHIINTITREGNIPIHLANNFLEHGYATLYLLTTTKKQNACTKEHLVLNCPYI